MLRLSLIDRWQTATFVCLEGKKEKKRIPPSFSVPAWRPDKCCGRAVEESKPVKTDKTKKERLNVSKKLDELNAMEALASVRKREKWKWFLPSSSFLTGGTFQDCRAHDIRSSSLRRPRWNTAWLFTCLMVLAFVVQCVSALPPVIRIGTIRLETRDPIRPFHRIRDGRRRLPKEEAVKVLLFSCLYFLFKCHLTW